jgi:hypothetical protein
VVGGGGGSSGVQGSLLASAVGGLIAAEKVSASLGGALTPEAVLQLFDNGDIAKKDMVHLAARMGLGYGLEPKAAYEAIAQAAGSPVVQPEAKSAIQKPEQFESVNAPAQQQVAEQAKKAQVPVISDEEKANMDSTADMVKQLKTLLARLEKTAEGQDLDDGLENPKVPVKPAKPGSIESVHPNPAIKSPEQLASTLSKTMDQQLAGKSPEKDKVDRVPEEVVIKTIDSGSEKVPLIDQEVAPQPDPSVGSVAKKPETPQETETLKTMKGADGMDSKLEMPKKSVLAVEFIEDAKAPRQSYWRVAVNDEPVFAVTAEKAFGSTLTPARFHQFKSAAYGNELRKAIRSKGLAKTLSECFGGEQGAVLVTKAARIAQLDLGMAPNKPLTDEPTGDALPPMDAEPLPKMNIDKNVAEDLQEGGKKGKSPFLDLLVDLVAPVVVKDEKWSLDDVISELGKLSKGESALDVFRGKLEKKVEELKAKKGGDEEDKPHFPGEKKEDKEKHEAKETPEEEKEEHKKSPKESKEEEASPRELQLEAALKEFAALLPAVAENLKKGEDAEVEKHLKIRAVQTKKLAVRMAQLGMIDEATVSDYAASLARKSDEEIGSMLEVVERAEAAQPKIEAARKAKVGDKLAQLTKGTPVATTVPGGLSDRTTEELKREASTESRFSMDWTRPPKVDESQRKA